MNVLALLIPTSLALGLIGLACCIWCLRTRQYDDLDGAAHRILLDDDDQETGPADDGEQKTDTFDCSEENR